MPEDNLPDGDQTVHPYRVPEKAPARGDHSPIADPYGYVYYEKPERPGCLTAWFGVTILGDIYAIAITVAVIPFRVFPQHIPIVPLAILAAIIACCCFKIASVYALLRWRRWGFYGWLVETITVFVLNCWLGLNPIPGFGALFGVYILYNLLRTGGRHSVWNALK